MNNYGRKNISEETIAIAIKMVLDGYSHSLVAEKAGVSKGLIGKWMKKAGVEQPKETKITKPRNKESIFVQDWDKVKNYLEALSSKKEEK
jgi:transposase